MSSNSLSWAAPSNSVTNIVAVIERMMLGRGYGCGRTGRFTSAR